MTEPGEGTALDDSVQRAAALLASSSRVLTVGHIAPDADALGSALALAAGLRSLGIEAATSFDDSHAPLPPNLEWMPGVESLLDPAAAAEWIAHRDPDESEGNGRSGADEGSGSGPAVVVACDCSAASRMGSLAACLESAEASVAIDHHRTHEQFADLTVLDDAAPATGVLVASVLDELGVAFDEQMAACLYAAVSSDTGSFRYAGTTASTYALGARLLDAGAVPADIGRHLYDERPLESVRLLGTVLSGIEYYPDAAGGAGAVIGVVTAADRAATGLGIEQAEPFIDALRVVDSAEVALLFKEDESGDDGQPVWRISARSRGAVDVGEVCLALGGGGHRFAAGTTLEGPLDEVVQKVMSALATLG